MNFRSCFNEVGSSLAELMISLAIILGGISGVLVLFQSSIKGMYQTEAKLQEAGVLNELQLSLKNKEVCEKNFLTKSLDASGGVTLTSILDALGNRIANVNTNDPGAAVRVLGINIVTDSGVWNAFQAAKASLPAEGYLLSSTLQVTIQRLRQGDGNRTSVVSMALPLFVDSNAAVKGCLTPQSALEEAALATSCSQVGGVIDPTTRTCRFSTDCTAVASDGKPFETQCLNQEITELRKIITTLEGQVKAKAKSPALDVMEKMKKCMLGTDYRNTARYSGNFIQCEENSALFKMTPTDVDAFGYRITDPKLAGRIFDEVAKAYTDFYIKRLLEGTP